MISARIISGPATAAVALAAGLLVSGCYYYGYPAYPSYPVVDATYVQREFSLPGQAASGAAAATLPPQYEYAVGAPYADYYQTYPYPYPYPYYPPYAAYPAYYGYGYGYPAVSFSFGYWGGSGCCWGRGWHGGGWNGHGWHGGGGGWHGGGGNNWHGGGGGGWHGGGGRGH
ncbi:hypothetical protein AWB70_00849 [Caballeronia cordobensis]|uniref:Lipoprotein n=1 Tax=Caballeronia cordobensis TaxID=1353886 RepID=A0A158FFK2_CABCO|nr:hypothetical protein [Caballeronia cordobensis]SAL18584.1 hypothetical protein AWB70_00849 [Caballeronia cordobensis]